MALMRGSVTLPAAINSEWAEASYADGILTLNLPKAAIDSFINLFQRKLRVISGLPIYQLYIEKLFP